VRVAWFTPFSSKSAIAEYSDHVTRALAGRCSVELWVAGAEDMRPTPLPVVDFTASPRVFNQLEDYDLVIYNMGDHLGFHGAIYDIAQDRPGVVVLHDRICHNFFFAYWMSRGRPDRYVEMMDDFYGDAGRRAAEGSFAGTRPPVWSSDLEIVQFPLFEPALVGARGVVLHSQSQRQLVESRWFGPVQTLFLPAYRPTGQARELPPHLRKDDRLTFVTVGYVNPNKQVDRVIRALSRLPSLASRLRYLVVGPYDPTTSYWPKLQDLVLEHGLENTVQLLGYQPDDILLSLLAEADVCINLRYPSFEGGSASLMQQLALGKPVLVADAGSFAELPAEVAVKVPPNDDEALARSLEQLAEDDQIRRSLTANATAYAAQHSPRRYAQELLAFKDAVEAARPMLDLTDKVAAELALMGAGDELPVLDVAERELWAFIGPPKASFVERLVLRPLERGDERALARLFVRNHGPEITARFDPFPLTAEAAREITCKPHQDRYYGAFLGDRIVGMAMLRGWDEGYEVPSFGVLVDADFHGRGVGGRLTDFAIGEAERLASPGVRLSVYASNPLAHQMYLRRGFSEVERQVIARDGSQDERIVMIREFSATKP
jgi:glycosyltransferase involved in cell wall biosynthesis/ribosomal protein S18 acetylase RimI-like enzyme